MKLFLFLLAAAQAYAAPGALEQLAGELDRAGLSGLALKVQETLPEPKAAPVPAPPCYRLFREVRWKNSGEPDSAYRPWGEWTSYVSEDLLGNIEGIMTPWSHKIRAENLWLTRLRLDAGALRGRLALEKNDFPMDDTWDTLWERDQAFRLDQPVVFKSSILEREFRAAFLFAVERRRELCRLPPLP